MDGFFGQAIIVMKKYDSYIETGVYSLRGEILFPMTKNVMSGLKMKKIVLQGTEAFGYILVDNLTDESVKEAINKMTRRYFYEDIWNGLRYNKAGIYCIQEKKYVIPMQNASDVYISLSNIDAYKERQTVYCNKNTGKIYKSKEKYIEECGNDSYDIKNNIGWVEDHFFNIYYKKDLTWALYSREGKLIIPPHIYRNIIICKDVIKAVKRVEVQYKPEGYVSDYKFRGYDAFGKVYDNVYSYEDHFLHTRCLDLYSYDGELVSENNIETYECSEINYYYK